jgi:hypothetical protein
MELEVQGQPDADLAGRGLLFVPSVFIWPSVAVNVDPPWPPALRYPIRGVAALRQQSGAARCHPRQSPGGLGDHLAVLREAGLVTLAYRVPSPRADRHDTGHHIRPTAHCYDLRPVRCAQRVLDCRTLGR